MQRLAQPPAPALPPSQQQLTTAALQLFTERFPASPRKTVQRYLSEQRAHAGSYPPAVANTLSPGPASPPRTSRVKRRLSSDDRAETALVLHSDDVQNGPGWLSGKKTSRPSKEGDEGASSSATKKKPSLVAAMRPKMTTLVRSSPLQLSSQERFDTKGRNNSKENRIDTVEDSGSSPLLVARADAREQERRQKEEDVAVLSYKRKASSAAGRKENVATKGSSKERKGKGKMEEEQPIEPVNKKLKKQEDLLGEDESELADRLRARRERRRAKAVIVKDRTQSAKAVGAAAATKVMSSHRKLRRQRGSDDEASSEEEQQPTPGTTRKKRKASNSDLNKELQDGRKAKNVSASRLTLKVPTKLGLFHNGAASVKTKVGKKRESSTKSVEGSVLILLSFTVPDLAFSELDFLNAPRPSPPASSHSSSSYPSAAPRRSSKPHPTVKTYGSKAKKHRPSKYFDDAVSSNPSSDLPAPAPARKAKLRSALSTAQPSTRSRPIPPSPPRAPTPKKSKFKAKRRVPLPSSSPLLSNDLSELHSAHSREQRRSRSAQQESRQPQDHSHQLKEAVLDTSNFWKGGGSTDRHQREVDAVREVIQDRSAPPVMDSRPPSPAAAAPTITHALDDNSKYALSSSRSSASIDRLLQACEAGVYPPAIAHPLRHHPPESLVGVGDSRVSSDPGPFQSAADRIFHHGQSSLGFSSLAGSSTEEVRREVARAIVMGEDGLFRLAESSQGQDFDRSFGTAAGASEGGGRSSMLFGAGTEAGGDPSAWLEVPMDGRSLAPTTEGDEEDLSFEQLTALANNDPMPHALELFSHRHQYQGGRDSYLDVVDAGTYLGGNGTRGGEASAEHKAFRSAMKSHWYKSKC